MFPAMNGRLRGTRVFADNCSSEWRASSNWNHVDSFMSSHLSSFYFFCFEFFLQYEQDANSAFFISWDVSIELLYAHISQISNTTSRIPYSARASLLIATASLLRDTTSQFLFRIQPVSTESQLPLRIYMHLFPNFSPFPFLWPGLELQAKGDRWIWEIRGRQGGESPETRVDLHVMSLTCRAIHPRRGGVRTGSEQKPRRARRALRLVCFIGE